MSNKIKVFFEMIKFEHTIFALPFAYLGMFVAHRQAPGWEKFFWITLAMVSARTAGMTLNRIVDRSIDAKNPRTAKRALVTGEITLHAAWILSIMATGLLILSAWRLNPLCLKLAPVALVLLASYHYVKRFSFLCHFALGAVLAIAPLGGWIAVTGQLEWPPLFLSLAVMFWVAGFDILYSLQDVEFDRSFKLHSVPVRFGIQRSLQWSRVCHTATLVFLLIFGLACGLGAVYWAGVVLVGILLGVEQVLIADADLSKLNAAFFTVNGWVGIFLLVFTFMDLFR